AELIRGDTTTRLPLAAGGPVYPLWDSPQEVLLFPWDPESPSTGPQTITFDAKIPSYRLGEARPRLSPAMRFPAVPAVRALLTTERARFDDFRDWLRRRHVPGIRSDEPVLRYLEVVSGRRVVEREPLGRVYWHITNADWLPALSPDGRYVVARTADRT